MYKNIDLVVYYIKTVHSAQQYVRFYKGLKAGINRLFGNEYSIHPLILFKKRYKILVVCKHFFLSFLYFAVRLSEVEFFYPFKKVILSSSIYSEKR